MSRQISATPAGTGRGRGAYESAAREINEHSYYTPLLWRMMTGKPLSSMEAWRLGVGRLSAAVYDMRREGWDIEAVGPLAGGRWGYRLNGRRPQC